MINAGILKQLFSTPTAVCCAVCVCQALVIGPEDFRPTSLLREREMQPMFAFTKAFADFRGSFYILYFSELSYVITFFKHVEPPEKTRYSSSPQ